MDIKLAENIRTFRKQLSLTQEQLAEVLGVTVGAVYKWEARLSHIVNGYRSRWLNIYKQVSSLRRIHCYKTICTISFSAFKGVSDFIIHPIVVVPHPVLFVINR